MSSSLRPDRPSSSVILRGVTLYDIMKYWPWRTSVNLKHKVWDRLSCKAEDVTDYDIFLSHAWESNCLLKAAALAVRHNSMKAVLISLLVCWLLCNIDVPGYVRLSVPCLCAIICVRWGFVLTLGNSPRVFFDRCCIPQEAPHTKLECIRSIPHYLQHSKSLVLMWDEPFTTRLWCMFEFALFTKTHGSHKLEVWNLMTMRFALFVFVTSFTFWLCHEIFDNFIPVGIIDIIFAVSSGWYAIVYFLPKGEECVALGLNLRTEKLKCSLKIDKDALLSQIRDLYGNYTNFNVEMSRISARESRNFTSMPFASAVIMLCIFPSTLGALISGQLSVSAVVAMFPNIVDFVYTILKKSSFGNWLSYIKVARLRRLLISTATLCMSFGVLWLARHLDAVYGPQSSSSSSECSVSMSSFLVVTLTHVMLCATLATLLTRLTFTSS